MSDDQIKLVIERLAFISKLGIVKKYFKGEYLLDTTAIGWTHLYQHFDGLRIYLLLTCFDILGQPDEYRDFKSWLNSSNTKSERNNILTNIKTENIIEITEYIFTEYSKIYGVKNSFYKFIDQTISSENREKLYDSIQIVRYDKRKECNIELSIEELDKEKGNFLYRIRNSFTHKGVSMASPTGGISRDMEDPIIDFDGNIRHGVYSYLLTEENNNSKTSYCVKKWPSLISEIIYDTILGNAQENQISHCVTLGPKIDLMKQEQKIRDSIDEMLFIIFEFNCLKKQIYYIENLLNVVQHNDKGKANIEMIASESLLNSPLFPLLRNLTTNNNDSNDFKFSFTNGSHELSTNPIYKIFDEFRAFSDYSILKNYPNWSNYGIENYESIIEENILNNASDGLSILSGIVASNFNKVRSKIEFTNPIFDLFTVNIGELSLHPTVVLNHIMFIWQELRKCQDAIHSKL